MPLAEDVKKELIDETIEVKKSQKWLKITVVEIVVLLIAILSIFLLHTTGVPMNRLALEKVIPPLTPTPTIFTTYTVPKIPKKDYYRIVMVGDSFTQILSIHGGEISDLLNKLFQSTPGHQKILIDNYAKGGTNITQIVSQMQSATDQLPPLLSSDFDMILIESCGYNPLSSLGIENGLKEQTKTLMSLVELLIKTHPNAAIVFIATIAPHKETYAKDEGVNTIEERIAQASERMQYIQNHMKFAKEHNIPLIDIYTPSLTPDGDGKLAYINPGDTIHPSGTGVDFISTTIASYIYNSNLLPK